MVEAGNSGALSERVNRERVRLFFGLAKGNMAGILLGTVLISVVLHQGGASTVALSIWCGLIAISSLAIIGFERYVFPHTARTRISGCDVQLVYFLALGAFPGQSVFATTAADNKYVHKNYRAALW